MDNVFLVVVTTFVIAVIFVFVTFFVTRRQTSKKYKSKVNELDVEKNQLINVKILSEIMGHKDISITLNIYTRVMTENKVTAMNEVKIKTS